MKHVIRREDLDPRGPTSYAFEGYKHGATSVSLHLTDLPPGEGPRLHRHPYEEVFVIHEGQATYTLGDTCAGYLGHPFRKLGLLCRMEQAFLHK